MNGYMPQTIRSWFQELLIYRYLAVSDFQDCIAQTFSEMVVDFAIFTENKSCMKSGHPEQLDDWQTENGFLCFLFFTYMAGIFV